MTDSSARPLASGRFGARPVEVRRAAKNLSGGPGCPALADRNRCPGVLGDLELEGAELPRVDGAPPGTRAHPRVVGLLSRPLLGLPAQVLGVGGSASR
jgi:hypothetical protein